jgi:hypothetical protein
VVNAPRAIDRSRERALCQHIPFRRRSPSSSTMGVCILTGKTTTGTVRVHHQADRDARDPALSFGCIPTMIADNQKIILVSFAVAGRAARSKSDRYRISRGVAAIATGRVSIRLYKTGKDTRRGPQKTQHNWAKHYQTELGATGEWGFQDRCLKPLGHPTVHSGMAASVARSATGRAASSPGCFLMP